MKYKVETIKKLMTAKSLLKEQRTQNAVRHVLMYALLLKTGAHIPSEKEGIIKAKKI